MTTEPTATIPLDRGRINSMDPLEMQWWCTELGCTMPQLEAAVDAAGEHVAAVREVLHGKGAAQPG